MLILCLYYSSVDYFNTKFYLFRWFMWFFFMILNYIYYDICVKLQVISSPHSLPLVSYSFFFRNPKASSSSFQLSCNRFRYTYFVSSSAIICFIDPLKIMGGSKTSSIVISSGSNSNLPKCGCDQAMKISVANTIKNPNRKFQRCRNARVRQFQFLVFVFFQLNFVCNFCFCVQSVESYDLLIQDDEIGHDQFHGRNENQKIQTSCNNCDMIMAYLRKFGKDIGKEFEKKFVKEYEVQISSKKHEKTKKTLQIEKNKSHGLMFALMMFWIMFSIVYKLM